MSRPRSQIRVTDSAMKQLDYFRKIKAPNCLSDDEGYSVRSMAWHLGIKLSDPYPSIIEQIIEKVTVLAVKERLAE